MLEVFVRPCNKVIAALKLLAADEDAAVGVGRRPEFQAQDKIFLEVPGGGKLLNSAPFGRSGDDQSATFRDKSPVRAARLAVEADGVCDNGPWRGVWIAGLPFSGGFFVRVRRGPESPASEVFSIEQAHKPGLGSELIRLRFQKAEGRKDRTQRGCPFGVTRHVWMEEIGEFCRDRVPLYVGKERPGFDKCDLRVA